MTNLEAVHAYLKGKRDEAVSFIKSTPNLDALNAPRRTAQAIAGGQITMPLLDIEERKYASLNEVPDDDFQPVNMGVQVGRRYEGIEVSIPVEGDLELFTKFFDNRYVTDGLSLTSGGINIKKYDFYNQGTSSIKEEARTAVELINTLLKELESVIEYHHARLADGVNKAVDDRRTEILNKLQKDKDADPWG
jgi:hypothetical protein